MDAGVGDVEARAPEPRRPLDTARVVENLGPVGEREVEVVADGTPEALGLADGDAVELGVVVAAEA
jgi:hypothetical protein